MLRGVMKDSGNDLLSHLSALSSALITLTIEFGMDRVYAIRYGHRKFLRSRSHDNEDKWQRLSGDCQPS